MDDIDIQDFRHLYSQEAEQSVLGSILLNPSLIDDLACILQPEDFYYPQHQAIYQTMIGMNDRPIDVVTVSEEIDKDKDDSQSAGMDYLVEIAQSTPSTANVMAYAGIVKERKIERDLYTCGQNIQSLCLDRSIGHKERLERSQIAFTAISSERRPDTQISIQSSLKRVIEQLERRFEGLEDKNQIRTGYGAVDNRIQGYRGSDLIIVGGRPGMGKTTFGMGIAKHAAQQYGKVMVFSMEMPDEALTQRLIASCGKVDMNLIRNPRGAPDEFWSRLTAGTNIVKDLPIIIDDQGGLSITELQSRARREHRKSGIKLIMVDYIQLMNDGKQSRAGNRHLEISAISKGLKNLAKELDCPVVALSQLNRELEKRGNKRPQPSDLRESGSLEEDADIIHFLYRDEIYNEDTTFKGTIEINTAKFKDGVTGTDYMAFEGKYNLIGDMNSERYEQQEAEQQKSGFDY